jgi:3-phytase
VSLAVLLTCLSAAAQPRPVAATGETQPVQGFGPVVRGMALWVHPTDPKNSLLLMSDDQAGLISHRLDGGQVELLSGAARGVDVQEGFPVGGVSQPLVMVSDGQQLVGYLIDTATLRLRFSGLLPASAGGVTPESVALYKSPNTGRTFAFGGSTQGTIQQFEFTSLSDGGATSAVVRTLSVPNAVAGLLVDDENRALYVAVQDEGIRRFGAEPDAGPLGALVIGDNLAAPLGGLALYPTAAGGGYLLAVSGGEDAIRVFNRAPPHNHLGAVFIVGDGGVDAVTAPRHLVVSARDLGTFFPRGMVAVHDGANDVQENAKFVPWPAIAQAFTPPLGVNTDGGADGGTAGDGGTGVDGGDGGGGGGNLPPVLPPSKPGEEAGCSCSAVSVPGLVVFVLAGALLRSRRRRA